MMEPCVLLYVVLTCTASVLNNVQMLYTIGMISGVGSIFLLY